MDAFSSLSESIAALAEKAKAKLFHLPSSLGGRTALGFDGTRLIAPAFQAAEGETVHLLAPGGAEVAAKVAGFDPEAGIAVLALDAPLPASAWTAMEGLPPLGSLLLAAAYPSPEGPESRLDAVRFSGGAEAYIQTDGPPYPGFSGGALVAPSGELAGFILSDRPGNEGYAIPAAKAKALVDVIVARGFPGRAWLGLSTIPVEYPSGGEEGMALLVTALERDGPAEKAGVLVGDLLLSVGGMKLERPRDLKLALGRAKPGEALTLTLARGGKGIELSATPVKAAREEDHGRGRGHGGPGFSGGRGFGGGPGFGPGPDMMRAWMRGMKSCCGEGREHEPGEGHRHGGHHDQGDGRERGHGDGHRHDKHHDRGRDKDRS